MKKPKLKKIIITKPRSQEPFDLGEMLFVYEDGVVKKLDERAKKSVVVGKVKGGRLKP